MENYQKSNYICGGNCLACIDGLIAEGVPISKELKQYARMEFNKRKKAAVSESRAFYKEFTLKNLKPNRNQTQN